MEVNDPEWQGAQAMFSFAFPTANAGSNWRLTMDVFDQDVLPGNIADNDAGNSVLGARVLNIPTSAASRSQDDWGECGSWSDEHKESLQRGHLRYHIAVYEKDTSFSCNEGSWINIREYVVFDVQYNGFELRATDFGLPSLKV